MAEKEVYESLDMFGDAVAGLIDSDNGGTFREDAFVIAHEHQKMMFILRAMVATGRASLGDVVKAGELYDSLQMYPDADYETARSTNSEA